MKEITEAKFWLSGAELLFKSGQKGPEKYTVIAAMCIHSIIRANDALTQKFLKTRPFRHDEAPKLFLQLVEEGKILTKDEYLLKDVLIPAVRTKSLADYKGLNVSELKAAEWISKAKKFFNVVEHYLK